MDAVTEIGYTIGEIRSKAPQTIRSDFLGPLNKARDGPELSYYEARDKHGKLVYQVLMRVIDASKRQ